MKLKELWEAFREMGLEGISALEAAEESVTYGTNCFELVLSERPYIGLRFHYNHYDEELTPLILRIHIKKKDFKVPKEFVESLTPALLSAEEDDEWLSIALDVPSKKGAKELLEDSIEVSTRVLKALGVNESASVLGHVPVECGQFLERKSKS